MGRFLGVEISIKFCEVNCLCEVGAINRFSEEQLLSAFVFFLFFFLD